MGRLKSRMQRNADLQVNQIDDIFAKKIIEANAHPQHVIMKLQEIFPNVNYKDE